MFLATPSSRSLGPVAAGGVGWARREGLQIHTQTNKQTIKLTHTHTQTHIRMSIPRVVLGKEHEAAKARANRALRARGDNNRAREA